MKILLISFLITIPFTAISGTNHKHGHGHSHSHEKKVLKKAIIDKQQAEIKAMDEIKILIFKGKVVSSWSNAKVDYAKLIDVKSKKEWKVSYTNPKGKKGQTLFIFLKTNGDFIAANFTGK